MFGKPGDAISFVLTMLKGKGGKTHVENIMCPFFFYKLSLTMKYTKKHSKFTLPKV